MAYFDFVTRGSVIDYGLVADGGTIYKIDNYGYQNAEYSETLSAASGDTHYEFAVHLQTHGAAYVPYCKIYINGTEVTELTGTSGSSQTAIKMASLFVKSGDVVSYKFKSYVTSNSFIWIYQ